MAGRLDRVPDRTNPSGYMHGLRASQGSLIKPGRGARPGEGGMGVVQIVVLVVAIAAVGGYWWFKIGRDGGRGYYVKLFGLAEGEQVSAMWVCYYDIDRTIGDKVGEVLGVRKRGINVMAATTDRGRLVFGHNEGGYPPIGFEKGGVSVSLTDRKAEMKTLAGPTGSMEEAVVMLVEPADGRQSFRLQIPRSGFEAISAWTMGA